MGTYSFGRYSFDASNLDKVLFPKDGYTKKDLIEYYASVAEYMVPLIKDRPLTLKRYPNGIEASSFFQKNASEHFPDWIKTASVPRNNKENINMVLGNNAATLAYLANQGTVTIHSWLSKISKMEKPDRLIFDLDPSGKDFEQVRQAAYVAREFLEGELEFTTFLMTTGSKGLHIVIPIKTQYHFDDVKEFAKTVGAYLSLKYPETLTIEHRKKERKGRLFVDYLRNEFAQTGVAPYSVRAKQGAPVAAPVKWEELVHKDFNSKKYSIKTILKKVEKDGDPWEGIDKQKQSLTKAMNKMNELMESKSV